MNRPHQPSLPARPPFIESTAFDERNNVLFLILGLVAVAERVLSVVPELVQAPHPDGNAVPTADEHPARLLR